MARSYSILNSISWFKNLERWALCAIVYLGVTGGVQAADAERVKRVLIVHSFGSTAPPFTTHSTAFATALTQAMGKRVDLDEVSLDMARYAQPDMEETFVEFLLKRLTKWHPDVVVPVGSPAGRFVAKYRGRLFPQIPVIYTGMDRRTLPAGPLKNATFVGESFNLAGLVDDILQLAPDTTNIAVVIGASPLERYWTAEFRRAFEPFTNRISFTWFNDLTFEQMLEQAAKLPPGSFILIGLLIRDASGVTYNQEEALQRLRTVANAPINGIFQHELGLGIVGGRLYQAEAQGVESARIAIRVLSGEPVSNFPEIVIPPKGPQYDWRELRRWNISEDRLPPGSVIAFRQPTAWDRYRWYIIAVLSIIAIQGAMIGDLLTQRVRRRRAEADLSESREGMSLAANAANLGFWMWDVARDEVWVTTEGRSFFGWDKSERIDLTRFLNQIHPEDRERIRDAIERSLADRSDYAAEYRVVSREGATRWIAARGAVEVNGNDTALRMRGVVFDITDRKRSAEALRESEEHYRTLAETAADVIVTMDQNSTILFINAAVERVFGYTPGDLIGEKIIRLMPEPLRQRHIEGMRRYLDTGEKLVLWSAVSFPGLHKSGREISLEIAFAESRISDRRVFTGIMRDVTERKRAEAEIQEQRAELAHVARVSIMGELAASLAHELNQPLTAILSNTQAALRFLSSKPADLEEVREILQDIVKDNSRAGEVIRRIRALVKKEELEVAIIDIAVLIRDVVGLVRSDAILQNVRVSVELDKNLPPVQGDRVQLQQVLLNILLNAFDAMKDCPTSEREVKLRAEPYGTSFIKLAVSDRGTGLSGDKLDKIFQPFYTTKREGLGMGLSICRSIIEAHGGNLSAENNPDSGATFCFTVPVYHEDLTENSSFQFARRAAE
jgi:PAS domain S-box-containing protein